MAKRRKVLEMVQYDYTDKEEYLKHKEQMRLRGWSSTERTGFEERGFGAGELVGGERWKYTAYYYKDLL